MLAKRLVDLAEHVAGGGARIGQGLAHANGLAALPLILEVFGDLIAGLGLLWYLAALVMATREATDLSLRDAGVSVLIGFAVAAIFRALLGVPFAVFSAIF